MMVVMTAAGLQKFADVAVVLSHTVLGLFTCH